MTFADHRWPWVGFCFWRVSRVAVNAHPERCGQVEKRPVAADADGLTELSADIIPFKPTSSSCWSQCLLCIGTGSVKTRHGLCASAQKLTQAS